MKTESWIRPEESLPKEDMLVRCMNYEDGWEELAIFKKGSFIITNVALRGYELPFVQAWRYFSPIQKALNNKDKP